MAKAIIMPKFEMSQEVGTIIQWLKKEGEPVKRGEPILEVETDKVTMEVEAPASGIAGGLKGEPGDEIPVTEIIGYILKEGEEVPVEESVEKLSTQSKQENVKSETSGVQAVSKITPVALKLANAESIDTSKIAGTGSAGKVTKKDVESVMTSKKTSGRQSGKTMATPAARRVARMNEIDITAIQGSGPEGRVQEADVYDCLRGSQPASTQLKSEHIPFIGMRKKIAERMLESYQTVPHVILTKKIHMDAFQKLRKALNAMAGKMGDTHVSATALLIKVLALTLPRHRILNSHLHENIIEFLPNFNIGMAVAVEEGLIVPVIRDADRCSLYEIAAQVKTLSEKARSNRLSPAEVKGGTFTVSNLGPYGIEQFTSIIYPGQAAILAVGSIEDELTMDRETKELYYQSVMRVSLSIDHRIVDGAVGAKFLQDFQEIIENPAIGFLL
ncbi:MAG: 2-oxo acid dehydrogenase subunit E2 [Anaerolineaceae bacterium]|nr:2-oxo acid dehydrogenase subunit E2 [Anaerolineaceae bacterium]